MERNIPFLDLVTIHSRMKAQLSEVFEQCLNAGSFVGGPLVQRFEADFASFVGSQFSVGVSSGTDALRLALLALGIKPGDRVITVANTFIATTEAISQAGGVIDFVDVEEDTSLIDVKKLRLFLQERARSSDAGLMPKFIIPVHLYGQMANMTEICELSREFALKVVEDCAQAHGASHCGKGAGTFGEIGAFSFYPGKNLGALGEGGAIITNNPELADRIRMLREHGQRTKYYHVTEGYNARLDAMQAGFLSVKLAWLAEWNEQRRRIAAKYDEAFSGNSKIKPVMIAVGNLPVYHLYVVHLEERDRVLELLKQRGVNCGLHYPLPLHLQDCYKHMKFSSEALPVTEKLAKTLMSLPIFPNMSVEQTDYVIEQVKAVGSLT